MIFSNEKKVKKIFSVFLSLSLILSVFVFAPVEANAEATHYNGYTVKFVIDVTNDADGWNNAYVNLYCRTGLNGTGSGSHNIAAYYSIQNEIDDGDDVYTREYNCGDEFPEKLEIYTDFGGGITWRCWEADVKIYINGVNVKNEHITSSSGAFSSSDDTNTITIDKSWYPYPVEFTNIYSRPNDPYLPSEETYGQIFQSESDLTDCSGYTLISAYDQFGVAWKTGLIITNISNPSTDSAPQYQSTSNGTFFGYYAKLLSNSGIDHTSRFNARFNTANSVYATVNNTFDAEFIFRHKLDVVVNGNTVFTKRDFSGKFVDIEADSPTGYLIKSYSLTGSGTLTYDDTDGSYQYTFGAADGTVTARLDPIKYNIAFSNNGGSGTLARKSGVKYDKSVQLPSCTFSNTGYHFVGWNTEPDGSGNSYSNRAFVKNLTTVNDATVTLYAQWEQNVYTVTLVYPTELNMETDVVYVPHGGSISVDEIIPTENAGGHWHLTNSAAALTNITSNRTINLTYELVAHNYLAPNIIQAETCTVDGEQEEVCADCGYVLTSVIPHHHISVEVIPAVPATCTEDGRTEETVCTACNEILVPHTVIPAEGHDYYDEPEWEWAEDYSWARATWTCEKCGHTEVKQTSYAQEIFHEDVGCDRVYTTSFNFNGQSYAGASTYNNLYVEVPYIDENGNESTMLAASFAQGKTPVGNRLFVDSVVNLTDTFEMAEDVQIILCDEGKLNINISDTEKTGIEMYDSYDTSSHYAKDLVVFGQTNQTGELNISLTNPASQSNGIECNAYKQYGGKVNINVLSATHWFYGSSNAIKASGYASHAPDIIVKRGILNAYAANGFALYSIYGNVYLEGGQITALTGNSEYGGVGSFQQNIILGCSNDDDFITSSGYEPKEHGGSVRITDGQVLTDGEGNNYIHTLTGEQIGAIAGKTLSLIHLSYDINEDGYEDVNDIGFIISASAGLIDETDSRLSRADLNGDTVVDAFDAAELDRILFANSCAKGDVNQDGEINLADYAMTKAHISGVAVDNNTPANLLDKSYLTSEYDGIKDNYDNGTIITQQYYCADYDGDKAVDAFDLFYLDKRINNIA